MKTNFLFAAALLVGIFLYAPVTADDRPTVLEQNSEESITQKTEESSNFTAEESKQKTGVDEGSSKSVEQGDEKKSGENKPLSEEESKKSVPAGKKAPEKTEQTKPVKQHEPDRRWIIKQRTAEKDTLPKKNAVPINWKDKKQQARCEKYLGSLKDNFIKARYYSIQGDSCATADYADAFLKVKDVCRRECPQDFLVKSGYNNEIVRNLELLKELGTKRCPYKIETFKQGEVSGKKVKE